MKNKEQNLDIEIDSNFIPYGPIMAFSEKQSDNSSKK